MKTSEKYSIFKIVRQISKIQIGVVGWVYPALTVGNSTVVGRRLILYLLLSNIIVFFSLKTTFLMRIAQIQEVQ